MDSMETIPHQADSYVAREESARDAEVPMREEVQRGWESGSLIGDRSC